MKVIVPDLPAFQSLAKHGAELLPYRSQDGQTFDQADGVIFLLGVEQAQRRALMNTPGVQWVLTLTAGVDHLAPDLPQGVRLFNANALHAHAVAVHVVAGLLAASRQLHTYRDAQREGQWQRLPERMHTLQGQRVALWGYGHIGREIERLLEPFGAEVFTVRSGSSEQEKAEVRAQADFLVLLLPSTPDTRGSIDAEFLRGMKPGAWLYNIGRGDLVVQDDLVEVLRGGHLGGALLDVTEPEPLPAGHPLWSLDNVILTPHVGSATADLNERAADYAGAFLQALLQGKQPEGEVDTGRGY
ncbi:2-hydroxyacid dehydrogenase [Deinococcus piscis]|uniref:2-hydroxyacid dehydrogenase n=1 Tax=Deinococcus piscis TaxID=394230 RepID=A0ABQ3K789_9DEIO|nr:NAD(P)-dependent oxidoreductase [Deinococcus piscis]GHG03169.1 2-hydroxyacid dehydrogenase [Deinococcus piscis]